MIYKNKKKLQMWYQVKELTKRGLNKSQIRRETGLDRATISKYQLMSEEEFHSWISNTRHLPKKLQPYMGYVRKTLDLHPYLSAAQVEDWLKENYPDLPSVHSKTVYNFVQNVRKKYDIPKPPKGEGRVFEKIPEPAYGEEAQVDFGETWMRTKQGKRKKVYFFAMSLSRSRYKYIYFQDKNYTASMAIKAHQLAFEYFAGVPRMIIYDQDSVFIYDENLGDYQLTKEFSAYCKTQSYKTVFCRKSDPQSKGKIENVVKYVKQNFLRGREYVDIETLNTQAIAWLKRTANAKIHSTTRLIPQKEWEKEKVYLLPIKQKYTDNTLRAYNVRKDNTIVYKSNFYTLPLGTYKDTNSKILLEIKDEKVIIYTVNRELICSHRLCHEQGQTIRNTDHKRAKSQTLELMEKKVLKLLGANKYAQQYLKAIKKDKSRYYRDNLQYILKSEDQYDDKVIQEALIFCIENKVLNAKSFLEILNRKKQEHLSKEKAPTEIEPNISSRVEQTEMEVEQSDINTYQKIFE